MALRQMTAALPFLRRSDGFAKPLHTVRRQAEDAERLLSATPLIRSVSPVLPARGHTGGLPQRRGRLCTGRT